MDLLGEEARRWGMEAGIWAVLLGIWESTGRATGGKEMRDCRP